MPMRIILTFLILCTSALVWGQEDLQWWDNIHNWEGNGPREHSLIESSEYFGPNALPPLQALNGLIPQEGNFDFSALGHFAKGDLTLNNYVKVQIPLAKGLVAFNTWLVPIEYYQTDTVIRDKRRALERDGRGIAGGDFYFTSLIQVIKDHEKLPNIIFRMGFKTASGTNQKAARYTETPGYYFDVTAGKDLKNSAFSYSLGAGFYAWQTYSAVNPQDDAFSYAVRLDYKGLKSILLQSNLRGYLGYRNNGDRPMIAQLGAEISLSKQMQGIIKVQHGIFDYPFTSAELGISYRPALGL